MSTAALKRELALLRSSLAALTPAQSAVPDDPVAWAERIAGLTLDPWQRDVLLSTAPRLLLNATRQSGKSTAAALKAAWTVLQGGLAVVVSPSLRQSGFLFRKLARHLVASDARFRRETMTEVELVAGGLAVSLPGDRPAMLRGLSLRRVMGNDLADARGGARRAADPIVDSRRRQRRVSPRLVLKRGLAAGADHRRSMSAHLG